MAVIEQLPIPGLAKDGKKVAEMARIWLVDGNQVLTISPRLWPDPGNWGIMLVDFAKHVAKAYEAKGHDPADALDAIKRAMEAEWSHPTD